MMLYPSTPASLRSSMSGCSFRAVYGPVRSWRFGRSLGIDPIGRISTCSFNCVYCQLGEIQLSTVHRQVFVPTQHIVQELNAFAGREPVDVVSLSGSGEPTLALNLREILVAAKQILQCPTVVLTNSTLLGDPSVQRDLCCADIVAAKLDAFSAAALHRINRPATEVDWSALLAGLLAFRQGYNGCFAIQTMMLSPWAPETEAQFIQLLQNLQPDEVQLNIPTRPRALSRQLDARGNHEPELRTYAAQP
ncbi:MAG TPA: radical SAM protein, partial [Stenomitos sp.]